ncbi:pogo transposable element with KRAB domain [Ixodes scapularis]
MGRGQGGTTTMRSPTNPFLFLLQVFVLIALPSSYNDHGQSKAEECQLFSDLTSVYHFNVESGTVFDERVFAFVPSVQSCCSIASSSTSTTLSTYAPNGISFSGQGGTTTMRSPTNPFLFLLQVFVLIALPSSYNDHGQSKAEECQLFSDLTSVYHFNVESGTVFDERVFAFVPSVQSCCSIASSSTSTTLSTYAPNGISFSGQGGTTTMRSPTNPFLFLLQATRKGFNGPQRGRFPKLESALSDFVEELRTNQLPVSSDIIKVKALQLALSFRIPRTSFKASRSWITKFMKRKGFSMRRRTSTCQKLPEAYEEKLVAFQRFVIMLRRTNNYIAGQMGNADQMPMFFDMPSNYTVETKGATQVKILTSGNEKIRVTAMLCCTADGHKLNPYLIFKRKTLPANVAFPSNVIVRVHPKGWMDTDLMVDWIDFVWRKRPGADLAVRSMLVLDSFRCHITQRVKDKLAVCRTNLVIPGGMTSQL